MHVMALRHAFTGLRLRCDSITLYQRDSLEVIRQDAGREQAGQTSADNDSVMSCTGKIAASLLRGPFSAARRR
jgi:hypothetical protein